MNRKTIINIILTIWLFLLPATQQAQADDAASPEYQIKAAFLYNFLKFVEWPKAKIRESNESVIIGIIGKNVFKNSFEYIEDKTIEGKKVDIKQFKGFEELQKADQEKRSKQHPQIKDIRKSHLLFICPSEKKKIADILESVKGYGVLTVADTDGFLETGGIINLMMEEKKVRFEINMAAAKQAKIQIRSQLLRLAKKVVRQETSSVDINPSFAAKETFPFKKPTEKTPGFS